MHVKSVCFRQLKGTLCACDQDGTTSAAFWERKNPFLQDYTLFQIKSNHFYCHITTAQVPWWVKFLWACSRQCRKTTDNLPMDRQCKKKKKKNNRQFTYGQTVQKTALEHLQCSRQWKKQKNNNNLHMDRQCKKATAIYIWTVYLQTVQKTMCKIHIHILSTHSVL